MHSNGDDYWVLFNSVRMRLNDIYAFRSNLGDSWDLLQTEAFAFKFRMLIEELCLFLRSALVERGELSAKAKGAYGPNSILRNHAEQVSQMRFITAKSFCETSLTDQEFDIKFEYERFVSFSIDDLDTIYGQLGNFTHPSIKKFDEANARAILSKCFEFYKKYQGVFRRHALERVTVQSVAPPTNLGNLLFILGSMDNGKDVLWRCDNGNWNRREPQSASINDRL
jgi:hypothetical protein